MQQALIKDSTLLKVSTANNFCPSPLVVTRLIVATGQHELKEPCCHSDIHLFKWTQSFKTFIWFP